MSLLCSIANWRGMVANIAGRESVVSHDRQSPNIFEYHCHIREIPVCVGDRVVLREVDIDGARLG